MSRSPSPAGDPGAPTRLLRLPRRLIAVRMRAAGTANLVLLTLVSAAIATGGLVGSTILFGKLAPYPGMGQSLLLAAFTAVGILRLTAGLRPAIERLYANPDIELLMSAPVTPGALLAAMVLDVVAAGPLSIVLLWTLSAGYALGNGAPAALPLALAAPAALAVAAAAAAIAITTVVVRLIPPRRLQAGLAVLGMAAALLLGMGISAIGAGFRRLLPAAPGTAPPLEDQLRTARAALHAVPLAWPAAALTDAARGRWIGAGASAALTGAMLAAVCGLAYAAFRSSFFVGWGRAREVVPRRQRGRMERALPALPWVSRAVVLKEWRLVARDPRALLRALMPLAMGTYVAVAAHEGSLAVAAVVLPLAGALVGDSFGREGTSMGLLRAAPVSARRVFASKFLAYYLPAVAAAWALIGASGARGRTTGFPLPALLALAAGLAAGVVSIYLSAGALGTRLGTEEARVGFAAVMLSVLGSFAFLGVGTVFALWARGAVAGTLPRALSNPAFGVAAAACLLGACGAIVAVSGRAVRRLETADVG
ncbi:MAG: hypothetical protein HY775_08045 [Acidobacteria bacterium]|nr:hypothetical protein [Acidobacteriota bacterium]